MDSETVDSEIVDSETVDGGAAVRLQPLRRFALLLNVHAKRTTSYHASALFDPLHIA